MPVVLHVRDAYGEVLEILKEERKNFKINILLHCYSSSAEMVKEFAKLDCYFALGGVVTFKKAKKEDVILAIPKDRLLLETDCPYMAPEPHRGEVNEPKYVNYVAEKIASVLGVTKEEIEKITTENAKRFYRI